MSRDKHRAWDTRTGKIFGTPNFPFDGFSIFGECTLIATPYIEDLQYIEIEQYTDYCDREGTEICEGDIVEVRHSLDHEIESVRDNLICKGVVIYENCHYVLRHKGKNGCHMPLYARGGEEQLLIVGNTHTNPEILES